VFQIFQSRNGQLPCFDLVNYGSSKILFCCGRTLLLPSLALWYIRVHRYMYLHTYMMDEGKVVSVVQCGGTTELCPVCCHRSKPRSAMALSLPLCCRLSHARQATGLITPLLSVLSVSLTASRSPPMPFDVLDRGVSHGTFVLASGNPPR
jgi:hypothetical protein